ncbi:Reverse transcriptase domain-containing protein [Plasmodiophora brassicae]
MQTVDLGFFLSKMRRVFAQSAELRPSQRPSLEQFADKYRDVFDRDADAPDRVDYRRPCRPADLDPEEAGAFSPGAVASAIGRQAWMKGIGPDNLPLDVFKGDTEAASQWISAMFVVFYALQLVPSAWKSAFMKPLLKKDCDSMDPGSWRGIALQSHLRKTYERCLVWLMQSRDWLRVHRLQFGFQDGIGCPEAIWVASELIDKYRRLKQPVTTILLDIQKAFDTTERQLVYEKLLARGVPAHVVAVVQSLFDGCTFQVMLDGQLSSAIDVLVGVFQGAVLSPFLFNIQIDDLPAGLCRVFGRVAPSLYGQPVPAQMFADDTSLYALSDDVAQRMLDYCEEYARRHRFVFNARKSQVTRDRRGATFTVNGDEIPDEADLASPTKFLGMVMRGGDFAHDAQLQDRTGKAKSLLMAIGRTGALATKHLSLARKRLLIFCWVRARAEYGLAFSDHSKASLAGMDSLMKSSVAMAFGNRSIVRGNVLMLRAAGIPPAAARQAKLRATRLFKLESFAASVPTDALLIVGQNVQFLPFTAKRALADRHSNIVKITRRCPVLARCNQLWAAGAPARRERQRVIDACRDRGRRVPKLPPLPTREDALLQALHQLTWAGAREKLMPLQVQPYNQPHPVARCAGEDAYAVLSWICNRYPGCQIPCQGCDGRYPTSRFHLARCVASMHLLHPLIDWRVRLMHPGRADYKNAMDYVALQLHDYDVLMRSEPEAADSTTVPCIMPTWKDPTFRLSDRQRRWMHVLGTVIRATVAKCLHGAPLSISAQGVAALAGPHSIAFIEPDLQDEPDNAAAAAAVAAAEAVIENVQHEPDRRVDLLFRLVPAALLLLLVSSVAADPVPRPAQDIVEPARLRPYRHRHAPADDDDDDDAQDRASGNASPRWHPP